MLTKDEILAMKHGRELDALVAEKVMGWVDLWKDEKHFKMYPPNKQNVGIRYAGRTEVWNYSTDISAAWKVVEEFNFYIDNAGYGEKKYRVILGELNNNNDIYRPEAFGETAPEAICKAALLVKEGL